MGGASVRGMRGWRGRQSRTGGGEKERVRMREVIKKNSRGEMEALIWREEVESERTGVQKEK
jgi:hypothetical protein